MRLKQAILIIPVLVILSQNGLSAQPNERFSATNPIWFTYKSDDVYLRPLVKYNNGANIISPDPTRYPWEARLENGMPNVIVDENRNTAIYISSFINYASNPPSKVGAMVFTNSTGNHNQWIRPDAELYWYNPNGATSDDKISPINVRGYLTTNIVAVDIESLGMYEDYENSMTPIKLIYLPQRESHNQVISAYQMPKAVNHRGILTGFANMKNNRTANQINFTFPFINGDTHMNFLKQDGDYYFVSRLNSKRASLLDGETLPLSPDSRKRYRRETVTKVGEVLSSQNVTFDIALDMSTKQWEPYSMQPFRLPGFEHDVWWGLVTMFGTEGDSDVQHRQRTELAMSNDGVTWRYVKPGYPFLDNGSDPNSDDHGCINIAKPVFGTKFSEDPTDVLYFYAASNVRHVDGRNPGISLATGKYGKIAGLSANSTEKNYYSVDNTSGVNLESLLHLSLYGSFYEGNTFFPTILADVTQDPRGKSLSQLNSYVALVLYEYNPQMPHGKGILLGAGCGSSVEGTTSISEDYESAPFIYNGVDARTKHYLLQYFKTMSDRNPTEVISMRDAAPIPIVTEAKIKNAVFYGLGFDIKNSNQPPVITEDATRYRPTYLWSKSVASSAFPYVEDFGNNVIHNNYSDPTNRERGVIAVRTVPVSQPNVDQYLLSFYGNEAGNSIELVYTAAGSIRYTLIKDSLPFASMEVNAPANQSFSGKELVITVESVSHNSRKHATELTEDATVLRVSCPELNFEGVSQHPILWNWKHQEGSITDSDRANARAFSFVSFTAFVPEMDKIAIGAKNQSGDGHYSGTIEKVEISEILPSGNNDFWD